MKIATLARTVLLLLSSVAWTAARPQVADPAHWPTVVPMPQDPAIEHRIDTLLAAMSLEQKVGQIVQGDIASTTPEDVARYHLGSVLNGGSSSPGGDEFAPPSVWLKAADAYYAASVRPDGNLPVIPVMWGVDAVHGHNNIVGATLFPHNIGLGAMHDPALIRRIGEVTAREVRVTGLDWTFAPPSPSPATTAGVAPMRASPKTRRSCAIMPPLMSPGCRARPGRQTGSGVRTSSPPPSISSAMAAPATAATAAIRGSAKPS